MESYSSLTAHHPSLFLMDLRGIVVRLLFDFARVAHHVLSSPKDEPEDLLRAKQALSPGGLAQTAWRRG